MMSVYGAGPWTTRSSDRRDAGAVQALIALMPPRGYIERHLGGGAVMKRKAGGTAQARDRSRRAGAGGDEPSGVATAKVWFNFAPSWIHWASCSSANGREHRPFQNRGRVAFPPFCYLGPVPWTKHGKTPFGVASFRGRGRHLDRAVAPPTPEHRPFDCRPSGRGGTRPGAGRWRTRRSRVPHRIREANPRGSPMLVTLRVLDDVPALR